MKVFLMLFVLISISGCAENSLKKVTCKCNYQIKGGEGQASTPTTSNLIDAPNLEAALKNCQLLGNIPSKQTSFDHFISECE
jgi:hypothetical protein